MLRSGSQAPLPSRRGPRRPRRVGYVLPDGRAAPVRRLASGSATGAKAALLGANGAGKTTLLRLIAGDDEPAEGTIVRSGGLGVMRQFIGGVRDETTVRGLLASVAPPAASGSPRAISRRPRMRSPSDDDERSQLAYAQALGRLRRRRRLGGRGAVGDLLPRGARPAARSRSATAASRTLSGGEQKRLVLEALLRGPDEVLLLDEPDNYLDVPAKRWLEAQLRCDLEDRALRLARPRADRRHGAAAS